MLTGLVLAAGAGRRLGRPKAGVIVRGRRLIDHSTDLLAEAGCDEVIAVVRPGTNAAPGFTSVVNPEPDRGMGSSLRVGLAAAAGDLCVIVLVDQVGITVDDIRVLVRVQAEQRAGIVVARRGAHRSHPVLVTRPLFEAFAGSAEGDRGGRAFLDEHPDAVRFVDLAGTVEDIDTPQDLIRLG